MAITDEITHDEIAKIFASELEWYEQNVPMTSYEKRLLRNWVKSGHSPRENPGSRYLCLGEPEAYDFLTIHRIDKEIRQDMKGFSNEERKAYLMDYMGWTNEEPDPNYVNFKWPPKDDPESLI